MDFIESPFSDMSDRVKKDEEAREQVADESLTKLEKQQNVERDSDTEISIESAEEKYAPRSILAESLAAEKAELRDQAGTLNEATANDDTPPRLAVAQVGKKPGVPFRPPSTPRKNVIPSRRTTFETHRAVSATGRGAGPVENPPAEELDKPANTPVLPSEESWSEALPSHSETEDQPDTADLSAAPDLPVADASLPDDEPARSDQPDTDLQAGFAPFADLAAAYHDTSAAEVAWQKLDQNDDLSMQDTHILAAPQTSADDDQHTNRLQDAEMSRRETVAALATQKMAPVTPIPDSSIQIPQFIDIPTTPIPALAPVRLPETQRQPLSRKKALLMAVLLTILLVNAIAASFNQSFGAQGWASVWNNQAGSNQNLLTQIAQQMLHSPTPGGTATATPPPSPTQIVNLLLSQMTLDEKLGQMMMVQFTGPDYSPQLDAMISQYKVGSVLVFAANGNIVSKSQVKNLVAQMQKNAFLPLAVSIDQEGGTVDRLVSLDGPQPAAAEIGATGDTNKAYQQGLKDAKDLTSYGFNLNLAPVVDVTNVYNPQLYNRTYGNNAALVTSMAGAYLRGLQKSGKVLGTLKHFPGLGDVSVDPHFRPPDLIRPLNSLNSIDWAPYTNLIKQGNVYAVMVTHEYVKALDTSEPSSLSPKVIGILRNQMHFQGVIMTDSLTMDSISNYYSNGQAAAMAVKAGDDLLMGASSPNDLVAMLKGIKQAVASGAISQQQIDDSVRRVLLLKYALGLIHV